MADQVFGKDNPWWTQHFLEESVVPEISAESNGYTEALSVKYDTKKQISEQREALEKAKYRGFHLHRLNDKHTGITSEQARANLARCSSLSSKRSIPE